VKSQKAEKVRDLADFNEVSSIFFIRYGKQDNGRLGLGFPVGFHGCQLGRLSFGYVHTVQIAGQGNRDGGHQAEDQGHIEGFGSKGHMLFFDKVVGADAHNKKGGQE